MKRFRLLVAVTAVVQCLLGVGGAGASEPLTLQQAEARALAANPTLQAAKLAAVAAQERTKEVFGRHFGEVSLVGSYNHFERDRLVVPMAIELFEDPSRGMGQLPWDRNQLHYGLVWQVPLLAQGALHEGDRMARLSEQATGHLALFTREQILYNVRAAYRNALIAGHALAAARAYREALAKDEADAHLKLKIGAIAAVDAAKITYALRGAEAQEAQLAAEAETAQTYLAALMGEDLPEGGFELVDLAEEPQAPAPDLEEGVSFALQARNDLLATRATTEISTHKKRLAVKAFMPQLVLQASYLRNEAPSVDPLMTREWTLALKLPLFTGLSRVHAVRAAEAELLAAKERERAKELEVAAQVREAQARLEAAKALLQAGKAQRALGREVARVEHLKLEQGSGKVEDYLVARAQELAGETSYWKGLYVYQSALDYLTFVMGRGGNHD